MSDKSSRHSSSFMFGYRSSLPNQTQDSSHVLAIMCYSEKLEPLISDAYRQELISLVECCEMTVLCHRTFLLKQPVSSTYFTEGKLQDIQEILQEHPTIGSVVIDEEITPSQQRNLEKLLGVAVFDRTELILEIFSSRATTTEASLQVELARAKYLLPRLKRMWGHLSRQKSGGSSGGFVKGEGEKQVELDRRMIRERIHKLDRELQRSVKIRREQRKAKKRRSIPTFALVGYTNSGKSSLLNCLTPANTYAKDQLFATLDSKTRQCVLPRGGHVLVTDTVGFIRKLPHTLVAAFRSTLESALKEDFLLHVVDASHPLASEHIATTLHVLEELQIPNPKIITVLNKVDLCPGNSVSGKLRLFCQRPILLSTKTGQGLDLLLEAMQLLVDEDQPEVLLRIPHAFSYGILPTLKNRGLVISHYYDDEYLLVRTRLPRDLQRALYDYVVEGRHLLDLQEDEDWG